jgi:xylan 1,4-beta-xylosidase
LATPLPFRHTFAPIGNIDQFRWLGRADVQRHLALARDQLGVRYVRACAMYSPEMRVWGHPLAEWRQPAASRVQGPNWQLIDTCLEGLLELGLKPVYTTCFMPVHLTDGTTCCWPDRNNCSMPCDLAAWSDFVAQGLRHHVARYGLAEVRSWLFECWNEPNLQRAFFAGDRQDFFALWSATWRAVKAVHPDFRIGGPSTARGEWLEDFLIWTQRDGTPPDYLISHVYNNDSEQQPSSPFDGPASHRVKDSPHFAAGVIRGVRSMLAARGWRGEVHWNEWGRSWFPHDPRRETARDAAFIVKTMSEVGQDGDAFAYWCLSDIYDQCGFQQSEFEGNYGMLSLHGLRKPAWNAHRLLHQLGNETLPVVGGDATFGGLATRSAGRGSVLAWRYPAGDGDTVTTDPVHIELPADMQPGSLRVQRIGQQENNVIAQWRALGAPAYPTPAQLEALRAHDDVLPTNDFTLADVDGQPGVHFTMESPGVALVSWESTGG